MPLALIAEIRRAAERPLYPRRFAATARLVFPPKMPTERAARRCEGSHPEFLVDARRYPKLQSARRVTFDRLFGDLAEMEGGAAALGAVLERCEEGPSANESTGNCEGRAEGGVVDTHGLARMHHDAVGALGELRGRLHAAEWQRLPELRECYAQPAPASPARTREPAAFLGSIWALIERFSAAREQRAQVKACAGEGCSA